MENKNENLENLPLFIAQRSLDAGKIFNFDNTIEFLSTLLKEDSTVGDNLTVLDKLISVSTLNTRILLNILTVYSPELLALASLNDRTEKNSYYVKHPHIASYLIDVYKANNLYEIITNICNAELQLSSANILELYKEEELVKIGEIVSPILDQYLNLDILQKEDSEYIKFKRECVDRGVLFVTYQYFIIIKILFSSSNIKLTLDQIQDGTYLKLKQDLIIDLKDLQ